MRRLATVSIGIAAYNEDKNIKRLLVSLLSQKQISYILSEIIVASDASSDHTIRLVKSFSDPRIKLIEGKVRLGQQERQNQILNKFSSDILVILEGDVIPHDSSTIENLVKPLTKSRHPYDVSVGVPIAHPPASFYESILCSGALLKKAIYSDLKNGKNVYTCGGHSMKAINKKVAQRLKWPTHVPEDAYFYFFLLEHNYKFIRTESAKALMRNVRTIKDRARQVNKYKSGKKALGKFFPTDLLDAEYSMPRELLFKHIVSHFYKYPFWTILYAVDVLTAKILTQNTSVFNAVHKLYPSSKEFLLGEIPNQKVPTISIGIPAYNEEENIGKLLRFLLNQDFKKGILDQIIVVSDCSTDNTLSIVGQIHDTRVKLISNNKRLGLNRSQNKILELSKSDICILLDADIMPTSTNFLDEMVSPFLADPNIGIVGASTISTKGIGFVERVLGSSHKMKVALYEKINCGNNIYLCHGRARAFLKDYYSNLTWPANCPEDAYSFLECEEQGFSFFYNKSAEVQFRSPSTVADHLKQSQRFRAGVSILSRYFSKDELSRAYKIPKVLLLLIILKYILIRPVSTFSYILLSMYSEFKRDKKSSHQVKYNPSVSTKKLLINV